MCFSATSDNLEVDTCSNRSICSSVDVETNMEMASIMADNLSDVDALPVSANVSGRETPSVSGRDTPLSSHHEQQDDEGTDVPSSPTGIPTEQRPLPELPVTAQKENRADIEEKFGRFEIPPPHREGRNRKIIFFMLKH